MIEPIQTKIVIPQVKTYLLDLQKRICKFLEIEDELGAFKDDIWEFPQGGGGNSRVLDQGKIIEKAGVNFSHVYGNQLPVAATLKRPELQNTKFQALGVSVVVHPINPFIPTSHFNVRFFVAEKEGCDPIWWFGGGFDLTPYYAFTEDCEHWHREAKNACDPFGDDLYAKLKKWCDDYFYLTHRKEPRGIGGLFFDDVNEKGFAESFAFMQSVSEHFIKAYQPIFARRKHLPFTQQQKDFQLYRRGRYVEFNLLYDRGTLFGLQSQGRTESILMSLPPQVVWKYNWTPQINSPEEELYKNFLTPRDWV